MVPYFPGCPVNCQSFKEESLSLKMRLKINKTKILETKGTIISLNNKILKLFSAEYPTLEHKEKLLLKILSENFKES